MLKCSFKAVLRVGNTVAGLRLQVWFWKDRVQLQRVINGLTERI